jgi:hypothetical protein
MMVNLQPRRHGTNECALHLLCDPMLFAEFSRQGDFEADARAVLRAYRTVKDNHDNCKNASNRSLKWSSDLALQSRITLLHCAHASSTPMVRPKPSTNMRNTNLVWHQGSTCGRHGGGHYAPALAVLTPGTGRVFAAIRAVRHSLPDFPTTGPSPGFCPGERWAKGGSPQEISRKRSLEK